MAIRLDKRQKDVISKQISALLCRKRQLVSDSAPFTAEELYDLIVPSDYKDACATVATYNSPALSRASSFDYLAVNLLPEDPDLYIKFSVAGKNAYPALSCLQQLFDAQHCFNEDLRERIVNWVDLCAVTYARTQLAYDYISNILESVNSPGQVLRVMPDLTKYLNAEALSALKEAQRRSRVPLGFVRNYNVERLALEELAAAVLMPEVDKSPNYRWSSTIIDTQLVYINWAYPCQPINPIHSVLRAQVFERLKKPEPSIAKYAEARRMDAEEIAITKRWGHAVLPVMAPSVGD